MAKARSAAAELARLLGGVAAPVYAIDAEGTLVYCNAACLAWLGMAENEALGQTCRYHSSADAGSSPRLLGLAPPPEVWQGEPRTAVVSGGDCRRARCIALPGPGGETSVVVAFVEPAAAADAVAAGAEAVDDSHALHLVLHRFRAHMAGRYSAHRLLGRSPALQRVRVQVELASQSSVGATLVGPPGSGRQHAAATIHYGGGGAADAFAAIDCPVLGGDWVVSSLRAMRQRPPEGRGTVLLREVDQLPLEVQGEVASVLAVSFPWRLLATARRRPDRLATEGAFVGELACLLDALVIELPPLAERREDIPLLAQAFLEEANAATARQLGGFTPEALDRLDLYAWPGNVDELAAAVAEACRRAEGPRVAMADLPIKLHHAAEAALHPRRRDDAIVLDEFLAKIERELIGRALTKAKGNKAKAARLLGLSRPRLYRRMVLLGLEPRAPDAEGHE